MMLLLVAAALAGSPKAFTDALGDALVGAWPECTATRTDKLALQAVCGPDHTFDLSVVRLYTVCRSTPSACSRERELWLRGFGEALHPAPATLENVVPGIRSRTRIPAGSVDAIVTEPFADDLVIVFLVDSPSTMRYLRGDEVAPLGLTREDLFEKTLPHVRTFTTDLQVDEAGPVLAVTGSAYASSVLLVHDFWRNLQAGHPVLYAAAPARDTLLVMGVEAEDPRAVAILGEIAGRMVRDPATAGPLSDMVLKWNGDGWDVVAAPGKP